MPRRLRPVFASLQAKFLAGTVLVLGLVMAALVLIVEHRQRVAIVDEVRERGTVLARHLASISTGPLLLYHHTALEQHVARMDEEVDVAYAVILDREGGVVAHSQDPAAVGTRLADPVSVRAAGAAGPLIQEVVTAGQALYDVAVPIEVGGERWGTARVGLSRRRMEAEVVQTRKELLLLAAVILAGGGLASALVARRIARPVRDLADGVDGIARGELDQRIEPATSDEIGRLALAFNRMAGDLRDQRSALEAAHGELRRRFAELSDLKRYTESILASLQNGIVTLDLEGRVVTLNAAAEALTGCGLGSVQGRPYREAFAHLPGFADGLAEALLRTPGASAVSVVLGSRAGEMLAAELTTAPLLGAEGHELGTLVVLRDTSAVRQLEEQLRRSDRLAAIGTLAAGLAHEIKNPLTSLLTFSRHLARRFGDERFRQRFQTVVPRELTRIDAIVDGLLRLARPAQVQVQPVDVRALAEQALDLFGHEIEGRQVRVVREYDPATPPVPADPEHLYQALVNLVRNALDAMPEGGALTVRVGLHPGDGLTRAGRPWSRDARLRVEVEDTGSGIVAAQLSSVFNPFFTTKPGGTGLGLAIAHKIAEDHGGAIGVTSVPGHGTTFTMLLPLTAGRPVAAPGPARPAGIPRISP